MTGGPDQLDLFEIEPDLLEDQPERVYRPDPDRVRRRLEAILAEARAASTMPWRPVKLSLYREIFPRMSNWLPEDEAKQLCFDFDAEMARLEAA